MATIAPSVPHSPPGHLKYRRYVHLLTAVKTLWHRRDLVWTVAQRDLKARYKQSNFGFAWALITPILLMVVFSLFLKRVASINTNGVPYPLFSYVGLLPWGLFQGSVSAASQSLIGNMSILKKVACPREIFPLASVMVAIVDMAVATFALAILFLIYGEGPRITSFWVPLILVVQLAFSTGIALILSSCTVYVRDLKHSVPLLMQLGLFATPVAYGMDAIPESIRDVYGYVNPMAPVIDGYRRTVLFGLSPDWKTFLPAAAGGMVILVLGYMLFKKLESGIADVA